MQCASLVLQYQGEILLDFFLPWSAHERYDGVMHGYVNKDATSNRNLQSLTCRVLLAQKACLELFINFMESDATSWPAAVRQAIKEVTASHNTLRANLGF